MNDQRTHKAAAMYAIAVLGILFAAAAGNSAPACAQTAKAKRAPAIAAQSTKEDPPARAGQSIALLVNDEPITAYEIEQRAIFMAQSAGGGGSDFKARAEARWAQIVKDPKTNERFQQLLRDKNVRSREEAQAVQAQYVKGLQQNMIEQLKRESRVSALSSTRSKAREELIEEKLKLQEAKKLGIEISDDEVKRVIKDIAERNKQTEEQFRQNVKGMGVDIATMQEKFRAQFAWREVIRRKFAAQISIAQKDVDRLVSESANETGQDTVELQVQRIALPVSGPADQAGLVRRFAEADALRRKFGGCKTLPSLAKTAGNANFEDMKFIKPSSLPEPTRSMLLSAKDGDMLPPTMGSTGVDLYAVCARRALKTDAKQREKVEGDLQQREFEIVAKRHLRDLRQDALIETR
jgi:peptidyl-prolyl cis-trans isomerase SurA